MELLSIRAYGRHADVSHETVRNWMAAGMPHQDGQIDPEAADAWRAANRSVAAEKPESATNALTAARTEKEQIKAKREAIKLGAEEGQLVPLVEMEQRYSERVSAARERFMIIPGKLAARLAACQDELQVHSILEREITAALAELGQ